MKNEKGFFSSFQKDSVAGIIVFLIALPLCLGIAQASHAPLFSGIVAGVIGGIVIGLLSKSNLSVSGPAAGLIAIIITALETLSPLGADGKPDLMAGFGFFLCAVMIAGALQLLLGLLKAGGIANYFPSNVIEGMLAGIGLTIIIKEIPNAVGYTRIDRQPGMADGETSFTWNDVTASLQHVQPGAVVISAAGVLLLALWLTRPFRKLRLVPAGLLVVVLGVVLNELFRSAGSPLFLAQNHLVSLPVPASASEFIHQFRLPDFAGFANPEVWKFGAIIAIVASIETLLCIEATDKLDPYKRFTSGNAELRAQGIGNILSGLVGGLPITSVIVRSSANINAGARTKLSTIVHGVLLLGCAATIPVLLNHIPKAALSAILIFTGYRLCRPSVFRHMWREGGLTQFVPFLVTVVMVAWKGLLEGVAIGIVLSVFFMLRQNMRIPFYYQRSIFRNGDLIKLTLAQEVSFLNKASIKETLGKLPANSVVIIDASHTGYIDFDVLDVIRDFHDSQAPEKNIRVSLIGFKNRYKVPQAVSEREAVADLVDSGEQPQRSAGDYKKLLKQLDKDGNSMAG